MRGGGQIVGTNGGEVALTELGQRGGFLVVGEHAEVDAPGDHPVLDVMHRVGDVVSPIHDLGLQAGPICGRAVAHPLGGAAVDVVEAELATMPIPRPRVFGDRIQPGPSQIQADAMPVQVKIGKFCAFPSKPPSPAANSSRACSPLWPYGGCPMSWAKPAMSTRSGSQPSSIAIPRPIWATSSECVSRVRGVSPPRGPTTCVLSASRRSAALCRTLARSRAKSVRR